MSREEKPEKAQFRRFFPSKKRFCRFCQMNVREIDYKNVDILRRYIPERGKISPRRTTGTCSFHQRKLAQAVKRARIMALLPFIAD